MSDYLHCNFARGKQYSSDAICDPLDQNNWFFPGMGQLNIHEDHLSYTDWHIDYSSIEQATLYTMKPTGFSSSWHILYLKTHDSAYMLKFKNKPFWNEALPFEVTREDAEIKQNPMILIFTFILAMLVAALCAGCVGALLPF